MSNDFLLNSKYLQRETMIIYNYTVSWWLQCKCCWRCVWWAQRWGHELLLAFATLNWCLSWSLLRQSLDSFAFPRCMSAERRGRGCQDFLAVERSRVVCMHAASPGAVLSKRVVSDLGSKDITRVVCDVHRCWHGSTHSVQLLRGTGRLSSFEDTWIVNIDFT